ncbi:HNH endonuclease [Naasia sp. SYSU D00057]|uniref:HNH endonuclease n=1 Tax=Naasia sp. SYSU D00057 TaxID=2817380 RepID=UPI001B3066C8|nr:HNH endonuclease [Naasia sp. SYSU D00057]
MRILEHRKPFLLALGHGAEAPGIIEIFIWNVTHGGATRNPDEYRVQVTPTMPPAVSSHSRVVLGWSDDLQVFTAWDPFRHSQRSAASPSLQVSLDTMVLAADVGVSSEIRGSGDVVVALQPYFLAVYLESLAEMHSLRPSDVVSAMNLGSTDLPPIDERDVMVQQVRKRFRSADFGTRVRTAYRYGCAVCGLQLNLTEAAHIVPVWSGVNNDSVSNGMNLCRNHHAAYDSALFTVDDDYTIRVSSAARLLLPEKRRFGYEELSSFHGLPLENLPVLRSLRPDTTLLRRGDEIRKFVM